MEISDIFRIRKMGGREFEFIFEYSLILRNLLYDKERVLLVAGNLEEDQNRWQTRLLAPKDEDSEITVLNYVAGVNKIEKELRNKIKNFFGRIDIGVDSLKEDSLREAFISTEFKLDGISYNLSLYALPDKKEGLCYIARRRDFVPHSYRIMKKFRGPNFEEE